MNVAYKNFSDMDSNPLTGFIKQGILAFVLKEITYIVGVITSYNTALKDIFLFLKRQGKINGAFPYKVTSVV
jgi:hypothetical protein